MVTSVHSSSVYHHLSLDCPEVASSVAMNHEIQEQLALTTGSDDLADHRALVQKRIDQVLDFVGKPTSSRKPVLSPGSTKIKLDFLNPQDGKLSEASMKQYQKKFSALMQLVTNASDGLNNVHKEICT